MDQAVQIHARKSNPCPQRDNLIKYLNLVPHPEGGYFREIYRSGSEPMASKGRLPHFSSISPLSCNTLIMMANGFNL